LNIHEFLDEATVWLGALMLGRRKFFHEGVKCPSFAQLLGEISLEVPDLAGEGHYEVPAQGPVEGLDPAFRVARWMGEDRPTLTFHHGSAERPYDATFKRLFPAKLEANANLICVRGPYHASLADYKFGVRHLARFASLLATSVLLVEYLVSQLQQQRVLISGISLGGWVTNLHKVHRDTADVYCPLLAGSRCAELFFDSAYCRMASRRARQNPEAVRRVLNFDRRFVAADRSNVFPVLGRYDRIIVCDSQGQDYLQENLRVLRKGHVTAALCKSNLRGHLRRYLLRK